MRPTEMKNDWTSNDIPDLKGKVCIVTGASAGLGTEIAAQLAKHGGHVIMAVRNVEKGEGVKQAIAKNIGDCEGELEVMKLDISSKDSVRSFAKEFREKYSKLDILCCNAGVMALKPMQRTQEGLEMQWATNHLGHFLLVQEMWKEIQASRSARITMQSSSAQRMGKFNWSDMNADKAYKAWDQYGMTKLANITFANELARRVQEAGLTSPIVNSSHPGFVDTELQGKAGLGVGEKTLLVVVGPLKGTTATGSHPMLFGATSPEARQGAYYGPTGLMGMGGKHPKEGKSSKLSYDRDNMRKLWEVSEETLKVKFDVRNDG